MTAKQPSTTNSDPWYVRLGVAVATPVVIQTGFAGAIASVMVFAMLWFGYQQTENNTLLVETISSSSQSRDKSWDELSRELRELAVTIKDRVRQDEEASRSHKEQITLLNDIDRKFELAIEQMSKVPAQRDKELAILEAIRVSLEECLKKN